MNFIKLNLLLISYCFNLSFLLGIMFLFLEPFIIIFLFGYYLFNKEFIDNFISDIESDF